MTRPLHLMVDIDDVICPTMESIHQRAFEKGLHDGTARMAWRGWESYDCAEQDYWDLWSEFALDGGYLHTEPIPGAVEALRFAAWEGHTIHLVTARGFMAHADQIREWTARWVETFAVPHKTLTFAKNKARAMDELGVHFDSAIDDSPKNVEALAARGVDAFLLDHQHNADHPIPASQRVKTLWEWIYQLEKRYTS